MGIMVWTEFPLACLPYEDDDDYLEVLESQSAAILSRIRAHSSNVLWCGGNELFMSDEEFWPPREGTLWESHHGFHAWVYGGVTTWLGTEIIEHYFGKQDTLDSLIEKGQWLQSTGFPRVEPALPSGLFRLVRTPALRGCRPQGAQHLTTVCLARFLLRLRIPARTPGGTERSGDKPHQASQDHQRRHRGFLRRSQQVCNWR